MGRHFPHSCSGSMYFKYCLPHYLYTSVLDSEGLIHLPIRCLALPLSVPTPGDPDDSRLSSSWNNVTLWVVMPTDPHTFIPPNKVNFPLARWPKCLQPL